MRLLPIGFFLLFLASCTSSAGLVGVTDFEVEAETDTPGFTARVWFPTTGGTQQLFGESRIRPGYLAVPNATVALDTPAPLLLLNHGSGGSAESMAWLATELAALGALVIAADHPNSSGGDPERMGMLELWTQPADVRLMLDQLLSSDWGSYIDIQRIAVVGFSLGGATAVSLAGGRLNFERFPVFCETNEDGACRAFRHLFENLDDSFFARTNADLSEPRLRAAIAIAPGFSESLTSESLQAMQIPLLIIGGERDQQLPPSTHVYPILPLLANNSRYMEIEGAQHFSFLPLCGEGAIAVLAETNEEFVCQETGRKSREDIHQEAIAAIADFLRSSGVFVE